MKTVLHSLSWLLAAAPLGCAAEDPETDTADATDEVAETSGSAEGQDVDPPAPREPMNAPIAAPAESAESAPTPSPVASTDAALASNDMDGAAAEAPGDAGVDCDYANEPPDPYPGCMRG